MKIYDVVVVGAGPAGIMAAIAAAKNGKSTLLIEKNEHIGRKILATGNGRCNVTNKNATVDHYHGSDKAFISKVLGAYDQLHTMNFFENHGVILKEEDRGRIFPRTNQASTIVAALQHAIEVRHIDLQTSSEVKSIQKNKIWEIVLDTGVINSKDLILATGGKAAHQFGSSGDGLYWAQKLGHALVPTYAALVPLETKEEWVKDVQGIKVEAKVITIYDGNIIKETQGDVLFTHYGLSGPAIMSQSRDIAHLLGSGKVQIVLDMYPDISDREFDLKLENIFKSNSKKAIKNSLQGILPAGLTSVIVQLSGIQESKNVSQISKKERLEIVKNIKSLRMTVRKIRPLKEAQVTRGGVSTKEVNAATLESKLVPSLFFAGEILDVDADSGGYNLQWAWSSGYVAGSSIR